MLRPIGREDYPAFFQWRTDMLNVHLWMSVRRVPTFEEFAAEMDQVLRSAITFLICDKESGERIGFTQAYNMNLSDGWCFILTYLLPDYRWRRHGSEASIAFFDYLFRNFNLRKIYMDVNEFNSGFLNAALQSGLVEEGTVSPAYLV